ncbi:MAG TPA: DUF2490 domain-containing protein [Kofleriaceae bacterium]|nr:DUF2490 domain-containing protein [Kofleriaceae bacterium]
MRFVHTAIPAVLLATLVASAAPAAADTQLWTELGVRHDLNKKVTLSFDQHIRFDADVSRLGSFMPEPGISYRVKKWFRTGVGYRFEYERNNDDELVSRHRAYIWGRLRKDFAKTIQLSYRLQLQEQWRPDANPVNRHTIRNRGDVAYIGMKELTPFGSVESHHILNEDGKTIQLGKVWVTGGLEWEHGAIGVDVYYRLITGQRDSNEPNGHVIGFGLHYQI